MIWGLSEDEAKEANRNSNVKNFACYAKILFLKVFKGD